MGPARHAKYNYEFIKLYNAHVQNKVKLRDMLFKFSVIYVREIPVCFSSICMFKCMNVINLIRKLYTDKENAVSSSYI
jgi:hypothetical protein